MRSPAIFLSPTFLAIGWLAYRRRGISAAKITPWLLGSLGLLILILLMQIINWQGRSPAFESRKEEGHMLVTWLATSAALCGNVDCGNFLKAIFALGAPLLLTSLSQAKVRIAVCQILVIDGDREGNFRRIEYALQSARAGHADIATFPESCVLGWENPDAHNLATPIPGADSDRIAALARKYGLMIAIGLDEKEGDQLYDSVILVDKTGKLLWKHRKLNVLPELMDPPYSSGGADGIGAVDTEFGRVGLMICADTFIDAYAQKLADLKPDLVLVPYGWAEQIEKWPAHEKVLERLVAGRAKMWKCPTIGTDLVGEISHGPWRGRTYGGASVVADASGTVLEVLRDRDTDLRVVELPIVSGTNHLSLVSV